MQLLNQVVNRELSQKIDELGIREESLYCWYKHSFIGLKSWWALIPNNDNSLKNIPAYTVAELGKMLPDKHIMFVIQDNFWVEYQGVKPCKSIVADTEANARAKMLIWLKENGYLK